MFMLTKNIISIEYTFFKFLFIKLFRFGTFKFYYIERFSPNTTINIRKNGKLELGKRVRAHTGTKLSVNKGACLKIGDDTAINNNCIINSHKNIQIGKNVAMGPGVLIYDHDHDYKSKGKINGDKFVTDDVIIGNNVWIGANSIILKGSKIGDDCVIAAGTVVKGKFEENTLIYNKKELIGKKFKKS